MIRGKDNIRNWLSASGHICWKLFSDASEKSMLACHKDEGTNEQAIQSLLDTLELQEPGRFYVRTSPGASPIHAKEHLSNIIDTTESVAKVPATGNQTGLGSIGEIVAEKVQLHMANFRLEEKDKVIRRLRSRVRVLNEELEALNKKVEEPSEFEARLARVLGIIEPTLPALMGAKAPAIAGPASGDLQARCERALEKLGQTLGQDRFVATLEKLATLPAENLTGLVGMLEGMA